MTCQFYVTLITSVKLQILLIVMSTIFNFQILNTKRFHELELEKIS